MILKLETTLQIQEIKIVVVCILVSLSIILIKQSD